MARAKRVRCPECEESFDLEADVEIGDTLVCPNCYVEVKLIEVSPPVLKSMESDEEAAGLEDDEEFVEDSDDSYVEDEDSDKRY